MFRPFLAVLLGVALALAAAGAAAAEGQLDLAQYRGKVVYLDFWASWCVPCRKSFPWLNEMAKKYPNDLVVVGVNVDNERQAAMKFLEKYPASFPLVFDPHGKLASEYKLEGMPSAVLIDRNGGIAHRHVGFREEQKTHYEQVIIEIMGSK